MIKKVVLAVLIAALFSGACLLNDAGTKKLFNTQPDWYFLNLHSYKKFLHILGVSLGFRALTADFDYISFLQYYGTWENRLTKYEDLYKYFDEITDADPHFTFAYSYGSAIFAFNLKQYDKAEKLINKGLRYNPKFWKLRYYLAAVTYRELDDKAKYVHYLEEALKFNDHPAMIETLLGNIYEEYKKPVEVARYWIKIFKTGKEQKSRLHAYNRLLHLVRTGQIKDPAFIIREIQ